MEREGRLSAPLFNWRALGQAGDFMDVGRQRIGRCAPRAGGLGAMGRAAGRSCAGTLEDGEDGGGSIRARRRRDARRSGWLDCAGAGEVRLLRSQALPEDWNPEDRPPPHSPARWRPPIANQNACRVNWPTASTNRKTVPWLPWGIMPRCRVGRRSPAWRVAVAVPHGLAHPRVRQKSCRFVNCGRIN